jgi:hypothetical protein
MVLLILYSGLGCIGSTNLSLYIVPIILSSLSFFYDIDSTVADKFSLCKHSINSFLLNHFGFELQLPFKVQGSKNDLNVNAKLFHPEKVNTPRVCHVGGDRKSVDNTVHVNRGDILVQEVLAKTDHLYDGKILELNNDIGAGSNLNFRVPVSVNGMNPVLAELDSDAHISLLSEQFFEQLKACTKITYLHSEEPTIFYGIGSQVQSPYNPVLCNIQIGRTKLSQRFTVTSKLTTCECLLGTDFLVPNQVSLVSDDNNGYKLIIGSLANPKGSVPINVSVVGTTLVPEIADLPDYDLIDESLEPGIIIGEDTSMEKELAFVKENPRIPNNCKKKAIGVFKKNSSVIFRFRAS